MCRTPGTGNWETTGHLFLLFLPSPLSKCEPGPDLYHFNNKITLHWKQVLLLLSHIPHHFLRKRSVQTVLLPMKEPSKEIVRTFFFFIGCIIHMCVLNSSGNCEFNPGSLAASLRTHPVQ